MNPRLRKWTRWFETVTDEIKRLLYYKHIFWEVQTIINSNSELQRPSSFYTYLGDTYVTYIAMGVRRQIKVQNKSISFARLLSEIQDDPTMLSRQYYRSLYKGPQWTDEPDMEFDKFCGSNKDFISPGMVNTDLQELKKAASRVEDLADRRIAHCDTRKPKMPPTFGEVDECLDCLDKLCVKYYAIFHAVEIDTFMPTDPFDWKAIFKVAWLKTPF